MNVKRLMTELSNQRPVFHSEGDFQFSLARLIQQKHPNAKIRLEYPYVNNQNDNNYLDIYVKIGNNRYGIELKYKTEGQNITVHRESYSLKNHAAHGNACYDFWRDVSRLEKMQSRTKNKIDKGFAIFLTNDVRYENPPTNRTNYERFKIFNDRIVGPRKGLDWRRNENNEYDPSITEERRHLIKIKKQYHIDWNGYSRQGFRYTFLTIRPNV